MNSPCTLHEFYSHIGETCVHCEPFCRLYPLECSETPECEIYITDYYNSHRVPGWAIGLIVAFILLFFAFALIIGLKFCPSDFLCKIGCMFSFKKKRKQRGEADPAAKLPYQTKSTWTAQDPVSPTLVLGYDIDAIRRRTVMDRFWASIEQHPPQLGVEEELEPLNVTAGDDGTTRKNDKSDESSENGTNGSDLNTAMTMNPQLKRLVAPDTVRPSLDNRAIIENYHLDRVTRQGSFRVVNNIENRQEPPRVPSQRPKPEIHKPVQKGRRTGLKNLLNPRGLRPGASETTV